MHWNLGSFDLAAAVFLVLFLAGCRGSGWDSNADLEGIPCSAGDPCPSGLSCAAPLGRTDEAVCVKDPCRHFCASNRCLILESLPLQIHCHGP